MSKQNEASFFERFGAARKQFELDNDSQGDFLQRNALEKGARPIPTDLEDVDEAYDRGYDEGFEAGHTDGYTDGYSEAESEHNDDWQEGYDEGYADARSEYEKD